MTELTRQSCTDDICCTFDQIQQFTSCKVSQISNLSKPHGLKQQRNRWTPTATLHLDQSSNIEAHLICSAQITRRNNTVSHVTFAYSFNDVRSLQIHTVLTVGLTQIAASRVGCGFGKDDLVEQGVDGGLEQQRNRWTPTATLHLDQGSSIEAHLICSTQITKTNNTVSHVTFAYSFNDVRSLQIHTVLTVGLTQIAASRVPHFANHGCQNLFQRN